MQPTCPSSVWLSLWRHAAHKAPEGAPALLRWTVPSVNTRMLLFPKFSKVAAIMGGDRGVSSVQGVGGERTLSLICATLCHVGPKAALCSASPKISFKDIFYQHLVLTNDSVSRLRFNPSGGVGVHAASCLLLIPLRPKLPTTLCILPQISMNVRVPAQPAHDSYN